MSEKEKELYFVLVCAWWLVMSIQNLAIAANPSLILDAKNIDNLPRGFRSSANLLPADLNKTGFVELRMSGSGQFSALELAKMLSKLPTTKITIVDLRQESHGFADGYAISWYSQYNGNNLGKTPTQVELDQNTRLTVLSKQRRIIVNSLAKKLLSPNIITFIPKIMLIRKVTSEIDLLKSFLPNWQLEYKRFYITDHYAPSVRDLNNLVKFIKSLPQNSWVHFHCRAGKGRTTAFMVSYDIIRNAKHVSLAQILKRQAIGGKDLRIMPPKDSHKYLQAQIRLKIIRKFYQYCKNNNDNFTTIFT